MWLSQPGGLLNGLVGGLGWDKVLRLSGRGGRRWLTLILAVSGLGASTAASRILMVGGWVAK